eukprot:640865_1
MSNTVPDFCHAVQCYGEPPQWPSRDCKCLQKLKTAMICARNSIDSIDIQDVLNNFIHLITEHDDAQSFESIYYRFGGYCDLENCDTFKRHHQKHYNISRTSESDTDEHNDEMKADGREEYTCHQTNQDKMSVDYIKQFLFPPTFVSIQRRARLNLLLINYMIDNFGSRIGQACIWYKKRANPL